MAQITPPVGFNLFVLQGMTRREITWIARGHAAVLLLMAAAIVLSYFSRSRDLRLPAQMRSRARPACTCLPTSRAPRRGVAGADAPASASHAHHAPDVRRAAGQPRALPARPGATSARHAARHVARANPVWRATRGATPTRSMVFQGAQSFVSPNWYAGKQVRQGRADVELIVSSGARPACEAVEERSMVARARDAADRPLLRAPMPAPWQVTGCAAGLHRYDAAPSSASDPRR